MSRKIVLGIIFFLIASFGQAQEAIIRGIVTDSISGEGLPYASLYAIIKRKHAKKMFITILLSYKQYHKIILRICQNDFSQVTFSLPSIGNTVNCFLMI